MKKSIYAVATGAILALGLAACGAPPEQDGADPAPETEETEDGGAEDDTTEDVDFTACMVSDEGGFDDASFNESGFNGLKMAEEELDIEIKSAESSDQSDYDANVDAQVAAGCNLIVGVGFALESTISESAAANPDIFYALVDEQFEDGESIPNARPLVFNTQEASFLAGYLAAGMSESGTVATYGGQLFPSVTIFMDGFVDGVEHYNEAKDADVKALGWDKEKQDGSATGDFSNVENGYNTTQQFISQGADIILPVAGPVGSGSLQAAAEEDGVSVIWVDADGYLQDANEENKGLILTSVVKEIALSVFDTIEAAVNDEFSSEPYVGTLENEGVSLAPFHDFEDEVSDELASEIDDLKQQIISGELEVDSPSQN